MLQVHLGAINPTLSNVTPNKLLYFSGREISEQDPCKLPKNGVLFSVTGVLRVTDNTWGRGCHLPEVLTLVPRNDSTKVFKAGEHSHKIYSSLSTILMKHRVQIPRGKSRVPVFETKSARMYATFRTAPR